MLSYNQLTKEQKIYVCEIDQLRNLYFQTCNEQPGSDWEYDGCDMGTGEKSYFWIRRDVPVFTEDMMKNFQSWWNDFYNKYGSNIKY
jgi:hypothetical protein